MTLVAWIAAIVVGAWILCGIVMIGCLWWWGAKEP